MKQAILVTLFLTASVISFARLKGLDNAGIPVQAYKDSVSGNVPDMRQLLSDIMNVVGLPANFELKEARVPNIEASVSHRKRYILYNPVFISWISNATKSQWAVIALLAHEAGHHLDGHTISKRGSTPQLELEADEFAGFVLHKLGASLEQSQEVMKYIARTEASRTHPARASRLLAIQNGWDRATVPGNTIAKIKDQIPAVSN